MDINGNFLRHKIVLLVSLLMLLHCNDANQDDDDTVDTANNLEK